MIDQTNSRLKVSVIGAGSWGTALAIMAARAGHNVKLWSRNANVVTSIQRERTNPVYLPGIEVPEHVFVSADLSIVVPDAELVVMAAPSHVVRSLLKLSLIHISEPTRLLSNSYAV